MIKSPAIPAPPAHTGACARFPPARKWRESHKGIIKPYMSVQNQGEYGKLTPMANSPQLARKFDALLDALKFGAKNNKGVRKKSVNGYTLKVDFANERIIYGEGIRIGDQTTSNFSHEENLVVLECVHRLLKKEYEPEHLTLEPKWQVGRGVSGGKADILVRDRDGKTMLIIECKTWGAEFDKEQKRMLAGGGQLFSYLQQDKNAKYLCLYASDIDSGIVKYNNAIVKIQDREEDIKARHEDDSVKLYRDAKNKEDLYEVWKERFNLYFHYNGIFENDVNPYKIELKPLKKKDLLPFSEAEGVFNRFAEILRHNNISDNANAFNRVLSLLLCKMVDEEKGDDEVLDFQVKEGEDTPEKIHDRLQNLYQTGMKKYLLESVVYHSDDEITKIIKKYPDQTPLEKIQKIFREIKYYTNNEFAFKEVHNKELFGQNSRVLNEVIKMLQNHRFKYTKKQQILGDFFELMLNHGVKQSEGQFFTPVPLVRFILLSIGLERVIEQKLASGEERFLPKILDYACGSGHFLTESIDELQKYLESMPERKNGNQAVARAINKTRNRYRESTEWAKDYIFGVEKDYRLARASQIACFINGDGEANIIFGDGLKNHKRLDDAGKFDMIVANPPYSVKAFKNYLHVPKGEYSLLDFLGENANEIQVLFLERAAQMLAHGGIAGIIMPSSTLSNGGIDTHARKLILRKFEIKAIAELGSAAFTATPINTVILFMRRRPDCFAKDRCYIAEDLFTGKRRLRKHDFIDSKKLLANFAAQKRGLSVKEYKTLIDGNPSAAVRKCGWFKSYRAEKNKGDTEKKFLDSVLEREKEKFYYYMLCMDSGYESQRLVVVNSGNDSNEQKLFRGYSYSARKGKEGIKVSRDANGKYDGKMYDDDDHCNPGRASSYILANIWGDAPAAIDDSLKKNIKRSLLADCLDFDDTQFPAAFHIESARAENAREADDNWSRQILDSSKWPVAQLHDNMRTITPPFKFLKSQFASKGKFPIIDQSQNEVAGWTNDKSKLVTEGLPAVIFGDHTCCVKYADTPFAQGADGIKIIAAAEGLSPKFLYYWLQQSAPLLSSGYKRHFTQLKRCQIPLPPPSVQKKIIAECDGIEKVTINAAREKARLLTAATAQIPVDNNWPNMRVADVCSMESHTPQPFEGEKPYYDTETIGVCGVEKEPVSVTYAGRPCRANCLPPPGTVGFATMKGARKTVLIDSSLAGALFSNGFRFLTPNEGLNAKFLLAVVRSDYFQKQKDRASSGGIMANITIRNAANLGIPVPEAAVQERIGNEMEENDLRIAELEKEIAVAQERKIAVLKKHLQQENKNRGKQ